MTENIKILPMLSGDLNQCSMNLLSDFLKSDVYVVFGSSYIKGELVDFLVENKCRRKLHFLHMEYKDMRFKSKVK